MNDINTDQIPPSPELLRSIQNDLFKGYVGSEVVSVTPTEAGVRFDLIKTDDSDYHALNTPTPDAEFITAWNYQAHMAHQNAKEKGFWDQDRNDGEMIALCHSELSEALEALRHGNGPSEHIPAFSGVEEEFADIVIRIFDMSEARGWKIPEAIVEKMKFNTGRPRKHGKEF